MYRSTQKGFYFFLFFKEIGQKNLTLMERSAFISGDSVQFSSVQCTSVQQPQLQEGIGLCLPISRAGIPDRWGRNMLCHDRTICMALVGTGRGRGDVI